jgi:hypothetical protein
MSAVAYKTRCRSATTGRHRDSRRRLADTVTVGDDPPTQ